MIKGIIFDAGGVLVNEIEAPTLQRFAEILGRDFASVQETVAEIVPDVQVGKIDNAEFCNRLVDRLNASVAPEAIKHVWQEVYEQRTRSNEDVLALVRKLRDAGYKLALLSNTIPEHAKFNRERNRFRDFVVVVLSFEVGLRKPDPQVYTLVLEQLGLEPTECIFIDDKEEYVDGAKSIGLHAIHYQNLSQLQTQLRQLGVTF